MHPLHIARSVHPVDHARVQALLEADAAARPILKRKALVSPGDLVGVRLNLNLLKTTGVAIQTLHRGRTQGTGHERNKGFWKGTVLGYAEAVTLKNAWFNVHQLTRELIAAGNQPKSAMASVDGELVRLDAEASLDGVEVRFNPRATHLFVDADNRAIHFAEEVTIVGHRAYARGRILYHTPHTAPARAAHTPTLAVLSPVREPHPVIRNLAIRP